MRRALHAGLALVLVAATFAGLTGCIRGGRPRWSGSTFYAPWDQYRIRGREGALGRDAAETLLGEDWRLAPRPRWTGRDIPPDLHAENVRDAAQIIVETVPLDRGTEGRELRYLLDDIVSALAVQVGRRMTPYGARPAIPPIRALGSSPASVGGASAHVATYDFGPGSDRVGLALVRTAADRTYHRDEPGRADGQPTLVLFALTSRPETFDAHRAELDALLRRVDVRPPLP